MQYRHPWWLSEQEPSFGLGRSSGGGNDKPLQYPCLENAMDRGAWWVTAQGVAKSQTQLRDQKATTSIINNVNKIFFFSLKTHDQQQLLIITGGK